MEHNWFISVLDHEEDCTCLQLKTELKHSSGGILPICCRISLSDAKKLRKVKHVQAKAIRTVTCTCMGVIHEGTVQSSLYPLPSVQRGGEGVGEEGVNLSMVKGHSKDLLHHLSPAASPPQ